MVFSLSTVAQKKYFSFRIVFSNKRLLQWTAQERGNYLISFRLDCIFADVYIGDNIEKRLFNGNHHRDANEAD